MVIPPGYLGIVEIIAPEDYLPKMTFSAIRLPTAQSGEDSDCFNDCNIGKRYRRWRCTQELGDHRSPNMHPTKYTSYNQHIVYWGFDPFIDRIVEFEWIDRPGVYYLEANRCENDVLRDCLNPTFIEFSLIKWYPSYSPLDLPGICEVRRNRQMIIGGTRSETVDPPDPPEMVTVTVNAGCVIPVNGQISFSGSYDTSFGTRVYEVEKGTEFTVDAEIMHSLDGDLYHGMWIKGSSSMLTNSSTYVFTVEEDITFQIVWECYVAPPEMITVTLLGGCINPSSTQFDGTYNESYGTRTYTVEKGENVTVNASDLHSLENYKGFYNINSSNPYNSNSTYTFIANNDITIYAVWDCVISPPDTVTITVEGICAESEPM